LIERLVELADFGVTVVGVFTLCIGVMDEVAFNTKPFLVKLEKIDSKLLKKPPSALYTSVGSCYLDAKSSGPPAGGPDVNVAPRLFDATLLELLFDQLIDAGTDIVDALGSLSCLRPVILDAVQRLFHDGGRHETGRE
jgi:hypothetical protein